MNVKSVALEVAKILNEQLHLTTGSLEKPIPEIKKAFLNAKVNLVSPDHIKSLDSHLTTILKSINARIAKDLHPAKIHHAIANLPNASDATKNHYLIAIKSMVKWAHEMGLIPFNMVSRLKPIPRNKMTFKRERRPLCEEEICRLLSASVSVDNPFPTRLQRRNNLAYLGFLYTGVRLEELRKIRLFDLNLVSDFINVLPGKNGEGRVIPIHPVLRDAINNRDHSHLYDQNDPLFDIPRSFRDCLRLDLLQAGIVVKNSLGHVVDVHSLRHTFATMLESHGANPKAIQTLMGHKSTDSLKPLGFNVHKITYGTYIHSTIEQLRAAINLLPDFTKSVDVAQEAS